jgi:hypothetical protein
VDDFTSTSDGTTAQPPRKPGRHLPDEFQGDGGDVVDLLDAAARIESRGYSDRSVWARYGYVSVFDLAREVINSRGRARAVKDPVSVAYSVHRAWMRAALLVSGALLAGLVQAQLGTSPLEMIVAGCAGWVLGQAVAGITWYRLRFDPVGHAARFGGVVAILCGAFALLGSTALLIDGRIGATGFTLVLGWVVYALSVSLLTVMDRIVLPLMVMSGAVLLEFLTWVVWHRTAASAGLPAALPAIAAVVLICAYTVRAVRSERGPERLNPSDFGGITVPVIQAALLAGALVIALSAVPESHGTAFVATAVLAVSITDPGIVALRGRLSWFAHRSTSLLWSRWFAWGLACLSIMVIAALAACLVVMVVAITGSLQEQLASTVLGTVLFSVFATLSSVLTAFGAQVKGLVPAALAVPVMLAIGTYSGVPLLSLSILACGAGLAMLIHQFSDARVFA